MTAIPDRIEVATYLTTAMITGGDVTVTKSDPEAPYELVKTMRASALVLGPLLARFGRAKVSLPGGCAIGARPIDMHLKGLEAMGAIITVEHGYVEAVAPKGLKGATIIFDQVTVTGTENLMMAAVLADGETVLDNAAQEPEVVNLADSLRDLGADIEGDGTNRIIIRGVSSIHSGDMTAIPDRIEVATYLTTAMITGGDVTVTKSDAKALEAFLAKASDAGVTVETGEDWIRCKVDQKLKSVNINTQPHPFTVVT